MVNKAFNKELLATNVDCVTEWKDKLIELWEERRALYDQCLHLALFSRDAEQAESWLTTQVRLMFCSFMIYIML